jgi:NADH:ubiquinone oxidoreductase subunit F (NADH-binding)
MTTHGPNQEILEHARRLATTDETGSALTDLQAGLPAPEVAQRRGLPLSKVHGTASFYDLIARPLGKAARTVCTGTACWSARRRHGTFESAHGDVHEVHCLGRCYEAPLMIAGPVAAERHGVPVKVLGDRPIIFRHFFGERPDLAQLYAVPDADSILARLAISGLRGRGGAAYPTAAKWRAARHAESDIRFVVANGDEGDPGSFVDRVLLEQAPHAILAGMNACAAALGGLVRGIVFIRGEYPYAAARVRDAIDEAVAAGVLVPHFTIEVRVGAGSYVCGEETALLRAIEGLRAEASPKPPYPAERGLFGKPTVVQNVETLSIVPWVLETGERPESKAFSLSGAVVSGGAIEAPFGTRLGDLLAAAGGHLPGHPWTMALVGGPMGTVIPARDFGVSLDPRSLPGLGHGGIVAFDARTHPRALAEHLFEFAAKESCGACAPCRLGSQALVKAQNPSGLERLLETLELGSLCGFGQGISRPIRDLMHAFPEALFGVNNSGTSAYAKT